ncbi:MAG: helix-turn-helix transcriptional regulator [Oscillospiraceae bacterium]|nr:helix-turn-helix transcriptional regulator [Oscillospiraceae bacterium]
MIVITGFSDVVKRKLKEKGLNQQHIANNLQIDKSAVSHLLNRDNISLDKMQAIAKALNCDLVIELKDKED